MDFTEAPGATLTNHCDWLKSGTESLSEPWHQSNAAQTEQRRERREAVISTNRQLEVTGKRSQKNPCSLIWTNLSFAQRLFGALIAIQEKKQSQGESSKWIKVLLLAHTHTHTRRFYWVHLQTICSLQRLRDPKCHVIIPLWLLDLRTKIMCEIWWRWADEGAVENDSKDENAKSAQLWSSFKNRALVFLLFRSSRNLLWGTDWSEICGSTSCSSYRSQRPTAHPGVTVHLHPVPELASNVPWYLNESAALIN